MSLALPLGLCHTEDAISTVNSYSRSLKGGRVEKWTLPPAVPADQTASGYEKACRA